MFLSGTALKATVPPEFFFLSEQLIEQLETEYCNRNYYPE